MTTPTTYLAPYIRRTSPVVQAFQFTEELRSNLIERKGIRPGTLWMTSKYTHYPDQVNATYTFGVMVNGVTKGIDIGDWVVQSANGHYAIYSDEAFHREFVQLTNSPDSPDSIPTPTTE